MSVLGVSAAVLGIYYLGLSQGIAPRGETHRIRGIGKLIISLFLGVAFGQLAKGITAPGAAVGLLFVFCVPMAFFLVGLGQLVGSLTGLLQRGSTAKRIIAAVVIIGPPALIGSGLYSLETSRVAEKEAEIAARAAFQNQTLVGSFGDHSVTLPVVPSLQITHACLDGTRECHTHFWSSTGLNQTSPEDIEITSMRFRTDDVILEELSVWCDVREHMLDTLWCAQPPDNDLTLRLADTARSLDPDIYTIHDFPEPIDTIICFEHWKGLSCRVRFDIAEGIEGAISTINLTPKDANVAALRIIPRAFSVWQAISNDKSSIGE